MLVNRRDLLVAGAAGTTGVLSAAATPTSQQGRLLAPTPPMGWNSWNSFATTINEAQARETAAIMARQLLPFGYDVFTIDIQWYEPNASSYTYTAAPTPAMDEYGRLLPAPNRFPSSADGKGFAPLASDIHALGLKFGIHLMRAFRGWRCSETCRFWARAIERQISRTPPAPARGTRTCTAST